jgi:hypothetical protein
MRITKKVRGFLYAGTAALILAGSLAWGKNGIKNEAASTETGKKIDMKADSLLKAMSMYMASLQQFMVSTERTVEVTLKTGQKIQYANFGKIVMRRPNRLRVDFAGDPMNPMWIFPDSTRKPVDVSVYYNDSTLNIIERNRHEYATAKVPTTIDSMIDYAANCFDIEAPASDLLFIDSYKQMMDGVDTGMYVGMANIDSVVCHHLVFSNQDVDWQIWIANNGKPLPVQYMITSKKEKGSPDFEIKLSHWDVTSKIPDQTFVFSPPSDAKKTDFRSKKCK